MGGYRRVGWLLAATRIRYYHHAMSNYRRAPAPGGTFFFTAVTFQRRPLLTTPGMRPLLRQAIIETRRERPFRIVAQVLLPDHLHTIWELPPGDTEFPTRWRLIKTRVTRSLRQAGMDVTHPVAARRQRHQHAVWQRRFWEHMVRDKNDLARHVDYIHWNPVKHGLVDRVGDWPWSTFHRDVRLGVYPSDWGAFEPDAITGMGVEEE
jgi:REP-associated tyrosine transposase